MYANMAIATNVKEEQPQPQPQPQSAPPTDPARDEYDERMQGTKEGP